ncbi:MAG: hypothetical protein KKA64_03690 [Nanoarchaeota archaeon]|nr:hypothetical protein [Nanoarchaeota archaeon]
MREHLKLIAMLILFGILFCLILIPFSSYVHEKLGHVETAEKYGVNITYSLNIPRNFEDMFNQLGKANPASKKDCEAFNSLSLENKKKITYAGIKAELLFFLPLIIISLFLTYFSYKRKGVNLLTELLISILIVSCSILLMSLLKNVYNSNPIADWNVLFLNCSNFS